jgi:hypothetical protein
VFAQLSNGKDVVANYLVKQLNILALYHEDKWRRIGFADALKKVFMESFNVSWEFIEEWKRKDEPPPEFDLNIRKSLQQIGDGFRQIQSDVWIRTALRNNFNMVISDGRYLNEAKMVKQQGGVTVLLWRPGFENTDPNPSESQIKPYIEYCSKHYSGGPIFFDPNWINACVPELRYFDYFLINNGNLDDLYGKIDSQLIPFIWED